MKKLGKKNGMKSGMKKLGRMGLMHSNKRTNAPTIYSPKTSKKSKMESTGHGIGAETPRTEKRRKMIEKKGPQPIGAEAPAKHKSTRSKTGEKSTMTDADEKIKKMNGGMMMMMSRNMMMSKNIMDGKGSSAMMRMKMSRIMGRHTPATEEAHSPAEQV